MSLIKVVGGFVENSQGKILFVQEGKEFIKGMWKIPTGILKLNESPEKGLIREVLEETGYLVKIVSLLDNYNYTGLKGDPLERWDYHALIIGGNQKINFPEILDIKFVDLNFLSEFGASFPEDSSYRRQVEIFLKYKNKFS